MASGMESKRRERKGGGSLTAICKLHFSPHGNVSTIEQERATVRTRFREEWKVGRRK